jgi:hypothetical protein
MKQEKWVLAGVGSAADFYGDMDGHKDKGLLRVVEAVCEDVYRVSGVKPVLHKNGLEAFDSLGQQLSEARHIDYGTGNDVSGRVVASGKYASDGRITADGKNLSGDKTVSIGGGVLTGVVIGIIGQNQVMDTWIREGKCLGADIVGKRECFCRSLVHTEIGVYLCIVGSDKLGAIYGLFSLSEMMGVSPWVYWGDVEPKKQELLAFTEEELKFTSKEPSVYYRGFFMNDEWPSLGSWVTETFGGFNELFYEHVFMLLLRMKGNYFWPAMWTGAFCMDGVSDPMANANLAQEYGIYMGNSHHEPMMRASEEWDKVKSDSNDVGYGKDWNYVTNERGLRQYWEDSIQRNKDYLNVITVGMRGERDTSMLGDFSDLSQNIALLRKIISDQKEILKKYGAADAPKLLALYKEVEDYYYGDDHTEGLDKWEGLDDILLLLSDDNYGNLRTLPTKENADRPAGWGLYYHFDYHGGPISYEWVNSTPLEKAHEQLSMAYDYGIRKLWIVNVGDLRPQELPLSFFMDLAYDFDTWSGTLALEYLQKWTAEQFSAYVSDASLPEIGVILNEYTHLNGDCRPEATQPDTFSLEEGEANREEMRALSLERRLSEFCDFWTTEDAFFGLVYYPAMASANVRLMNIYSAYSQYYGSINSTLANHYARNVMDCIALDQELTRHYNEGMSGGKWKGMMSSAHICFQHWNDEGWKYPDTAQVIPRDGAKMIITAEGCSEENFLPIFSNVGKQTCHLILSNGGSEPYTYQVEECPPWLELMQYSGTVPGEGADGILIRINSALQADRTSELVIKGAGEEVRLAAEIRHRDITGVPLGTYLEDDGVVCMLAAHYEAERQAAGARWKVLTNYGKAVSCVKMYPTTSHFEEKDESPWLEYTFYNWEGGTYEIHFYLAPTNDLQKGCGQKYKLSLDGEYLEVVDSLPKGFHAGSHYDRDWCTQVLRNDRRITVLRDIPPGLHKLRFYGMDAGVILQKIALCKIGSPMQKILPSLFYGPEESVRV